MLARMWKKNIPPLLLGLQAGTTTLKIYLGGLRKLEIAPPEDPAIPLWYIYPKDASPCHEVHIDLICNSQKLEVTQMSLKQRMDTENVVHLHNGILFSY